MLNNPILVQKVDFDQKKVEGSNPNVSILWKKLKGQITNMDNNNKQTAEIQQQSKQTAEN